MVFICRSLLICGLFFSFSNLFSSALLAQQSDWPMYRGNLEGTGYSALSQINASNVNNLSEVWNYSLVDENADKLRVKFL